MPADTFDTIVAIWAHPDDEILLSSGIMSLAARDGHRVVSVVATRGEKKSWKDKFSQFVELGEVREEELLAAEKVLWIKEHINFDYVDGECGLVEEKEAVEKIKKIITEVKPSTVLTFPEDGLTGDPDHKAVSKWVKQAFVESAKPEATLYFAAFTPEWVNEFVPKMEKFNFFHKGYPIPTPASGLSINFTIPQDILEQKMKALFENKSQIEAILKYFGKENIMSAVSQEMYRAAVLK